ncbi:MAG: GntR family transcriptional regulator [Smithellaceae bacterium]|nr:GntR family transcriptional regulator [Smithellaceae bacterium]
MAEIPLSPQTFSRSKLPEKIEDVLVKKILRGEFVSGEKLPTERALALSLDVNRSTVRVALSKLQSLDLIEIRHGDGVYVKDYLNSGNLDLIRALISSNGAVNGDIVMDLLAVRNFLAPEKAYRAARYREDRHLKVLDDIIHNRQLPMVEEDILVHNIVAQASRNMMYLMLLNFCNKFMRDYAFLYFEDPRNVKRSRRFHEEIYQAIKAKDAARSKSVMKNVLLYAERQVKKTLGNHGY